MGPLDQRYSRDQRSHKPLPRLPRSWDRICHVIALFLRSIGLGIVVTVFQGTFSRKFVEPTKAAIISNRFIALLRSLIHVLPVGVALTEIIVNWNGYYVGAIFDNQTVLQFAAKAHEITIQASLAAIIQSHMRHLIIAVSGLPFGALLGATQFNQISYLWSTELWSSALSKKFRVDRKLGFLIAVVLCTLIASTAGPSSATLLIPRQDLWPLKSFHLFLNATSEELWPLTMNASLLSMSCTVLKPSSVPVDNGCPLDNFAPLVRKGQSFLPPTHYNPSDRVLDEFASVVTLYEPAIASALCASTSRDQYCATTPQYAFSGIADYHFLPNVSNAGRNAAFPSSSLENFTTIEQNYLQPYTSVSCVRRTKNPSDSTLLEFARLSQTEVEYSKTREILSVPDVDLTSSSSFGASANSSQHRIAWIDLPEESFGSNMLGLVAIHPSNSTVPVNITTCTVGAGWGSSRLLNYGGKSQILFSSMTNSPSLSHKFFSSQDPAGLVVQDVPDFVNISGSAYPQRRIHIAPEWAEYINPLVSIGPNQTTTFIDSSWVGIEEEELTESYVARFFSIMIANGLSRNASPRFTIKASTPISTDNFCKECVSAEIQRFAYGWVYMIDGIFTRLAITVMFAYCLLAVSHVLYIVATGVSSSAWDSVAELVALAMNSAPTTALQNTCAGIIGTRAYRSTVRIAETTEGHLELLFGEEKDSKIVVSRLKLDEKYG